MARPVRNTVDYFPHIIQHGKKMHIIRSRYGNDGYAVWFMLLEELGKTDYHYLDLSDDIQVMYLSEMLQVTDDKLIEIIELLVKLQEFDMALWSENRIIYCAKFIEHIRDAYKKRSNECQTREEFDLYLISLGVRKPSLGTPKPQKHVPEVTTPVVSTPVSTQSKVEYIKVEERRGKKEIPLPGKTEHNSDSKKIDPPPKPKKKSLDPFQNQKSATKDLVPDFSSGVDNFILQIKKYLAAIPGGYDWTGKDRRSAKNIFLKLRKSYPGIHPVQAFQDLYRSLDDFDLNSFDLQYLEKFYNRINGRNKRTSQKAKSTTLNQNEKWARRPSTSRNP